MNSPNGVFSLSNCHIHVTTGIAVGTLNIAAKVVMVTTTPTATPGALGAIGTIIAADCAHSIAVNLHTTFNFRLIFYMAFKP